MSNFSKCSVQFTGREELHDALSLTGVEVSFNHLPAGANVPFIHSHKKNEEIYIILDGEGSVKIDNETVHLTKGDCLRISPKAKRQFFASKENAISYICIQAKENSLEEFTGSDGVIE